MRVLPVDQMPPSVELGSHGGQLSYAGVWGGIAGVDGSKKFTGIQITLGLNTCGEPLPSSKRLIYFEC